MRLSMFEHCSPCFRERMMAALKRLHLQETVLLDDDSDAMIAAVGKPIIRIPVRDDDAPTLGSTETWWLGIIYKTVPLTMPRAAGVCDRHA
jgi:glutaredoxin 2